jgi:hypothetical protein
MENFGQNWQSVTECMVPRMAHWSMHGAVWWSIDSNYCLFSKLQMFRGDWKLRKLAQ